MSYNLHEILLSGDLEGHPPEKQLICQDTDTPHIDLVIVGLPFQQFGRDVERSAAEGAPHRVGTDRPSEITNLHQSLPNQLLTQW